MLFSSIKIENFKSIENINFSLSNINVLIGQNNSGKSSFIDAVSAFQQESKLNKSSIRIGSDNTKITAFPSGILSLPRIFYNNQTDKIPGSGFFIEIYYNENSNFQMSAVGSQILHFSQPIENTRSGGFIIKYLSARKVEDYNQHVNKKNFNTISNNFSNLSSILSEITNPYHPAYEYFCKKSEDILGFVVTEILTDSGQEPGVRLENDRIISIKEMGAGICNIIGIIAELSLAKNKLFLIEEMENDIHPKALKSLLEMIIEKSSENQFIISTHSSIVLTYLSSAPDTKIYSFSINNGEAVPVTVVEDITKNDIRMREVLTDIGHHFSDFGLYRGWIIFEESSMETIVKKYLIKWFAPSLKGKIGTISAGGADNVRGIYRDMHRLYLFSHLQPLYAEAAWVILDGDSKGKAVRDQLISAYGNDKSEKFLCLSRGNAEQYYPDIFEEGVNAALGQSGDKKRHEKRKLLEDLIGWIERDEDNAKLEMRDSFDEVIKILNKIGENLI